MLMVNADDKNADGSTERVKAVLRNQATDGIDIHRTAAIKALSRIDLNGSVFVFIKALLDEDEDVRADASEALVRTGDKRAAKQLHENLLGDPAAQVKLNAIDALAVMGHKEVIPLLRRLLKGRDEEIVWDEDEFYASEWDDWTDVQLHALKALGTLRAQDAVPDIVEALGDMDTHDIMETGFRVLASLGRSGIEALGAFLDHADARCRRRSAAVLASSRSPHAAAAIARALSHKDADVRYACGGALMSIDPADARVKILLADANPAIRAAMASGCLQHHRDMAAILIKDPDTAVRRAVYQVLAAVPDLLDAKTALVALEADRRADDEKTAAAAIQASMVIAPDDLRPQMIEELADENVAVEIRLAILKALENDTSEEALEVLIGNLAVDKRQLRLKSMTALARMAANAPWPNMAGDALLSALRGELIPPPEMPEEKEPDVVEADFDNKNEPEPEAEADEDAQEEAQEDAEPDIPQSTLAAILSDDPVIAEVLKKKTETVGLSPQDMEFLQIATDRKKKNERRRLSPDPVVAPYQDVRRFAARLLGDVRRSEVMQALGEALSDPDKEVVRIAADSLTHFEGKGSDEAEAVTKNIIAALAITDPETRVFLIRALGRMGGEDAVETLRALTQDLDSYIVAEAVEALDFLGRGDPDLAALLDDNAPRVRLAAARMIAGLQDDAFIGDLVDFSLAHDGYHRREGGRLLRRVNPEAANAQLLAILKDASRKIEWLSVIETLEEINVQKDSISVA